MPDTNEKHTIRYFKDRFMISGILSLPSPTEYRDLFGKLSEDMCVKNIQNYTIDISNLTFMNSSGITVFCRILISARKANPNMNVTIIGRRSISWHLRTLSSLEKMWARLTVTFEE